MVSRAELPDHSEQISEDHSKEVALEEHPADIQVFIDRSNFFLIDTVQLMCEVECKCQSHHLKGSPDE